MRLILEDDDGERYELVKAPCGDDCCLHNDICEHGFPGEKLPCIRIFDFIDLLGGRYGCVFKKIHRRDMYLP